MLDQAAVYRAVELDARKLHRTTILSSVLHGFVDTAEWREIIVRAGGASFLFALTRRQEQSEMQFGLLPVIVKCGCEDGPQKMADSTGQFHRFTGLGVDQRD